MVTITTSLAQPMTPPGYAHPDLESPAGKARRLGNDDDGRIALHIYSRVEIDGEARYHGEQRWESRGQVTRYFGQPREQTDSTEGVKHPRIAWHGLIGFGESTLAEQAAERALTTVRANRPVSAHYAAQKWGQDIALSDECWDALRAAEIVGAEPSPELADKLLAAQRDGRLIGALAALYVPPKLDPHNEFRLKVEAADEALYDAIRSDMIEFIERAQISKRGLS